MSAKLRCLRYYVLILREFFIVKFRPMSGEKASVRVTLLMSYADDGRGVSVVTSRTKPTD